MDDSICIHKCVSIIVSIMYPLLHPQMCFHYLNIYFLDESIQKTFYLIPETEAIDSIGWFCSCRCESVWPEDSPAGM